MQIQPPQIRCLMRPLPKFHMVPPSLCPQMAEGLGALPSLPFMGAPPSWPHHPKDQHHHLGIWIQLEFQGIHSDCSRMTPLNPTSDPMLNAGGDQSSVSGVGDDQSGLMLSLASSDQSDSTGNLAKIGQ